MGVPGAARRRRYHIQEGYPVRIAVRSVLVPVLLGLVLVTGAGLRTTSSAGAFTPRVMMVDNDSTGDPGTGL